MPSIIVHLDDATFEALDRVLPEGSEREAFYEDALKTAIRKREYESMRVAYEKQPDSGSDADAWELPEDFAP